MTVRILYIDDDVALARLLAKALALHGIAVVHATEGSKALPLLADEDFDAIALDHDLVSESGLDLIPQIQAFPNPPPIIYVTGSDDAKTAVSALKAGAVDYVWKDVEGHYKELLAQSIKVAVQQTRLNREKEDAQRAIAEAKERAELLLGEVNHRVANSLTLVASLASMQASAVKDASTKAALNEMIGRILAIAGVHKRLYTSADVKSVALDIYLENLCHELTAMSGMATAKLTVTAQPGISMPTDRAISLGIVLNELVTNALKYAYPQEQKGEIRISLQRSGDDRCTLLVEDDGIGWNGSGLPQGSGLGSRIVKSLAMALDGSLNYLVKASGTRASFDFAI